MTGKAWPVASILSASALVSIVVMGSLVALGARNLHNAQLRTVNYEL